MKLKVVGTWKSPSGSSDINAPWLYYIEVSTKTGYTTVSVDHVIADVSSRTILFAEVSAKDAKLIKKAEYVSLSIRNTDDALFADFTLSYVVLGRTDITAKTSVMGNYDARRNQLMWVNGIEINGKTYSADEIKEIHHAIKICTGAEAYAYVTEDNATFSDLDIHYHNTDEDRVLPPMETLPTDVFFDIADTIEDYEAEGSSYEKAELERIAVLEVIRDYLSDAKTGEGVAV